MTAYICAQNPYFHTLVHLCIRGLLHKDYVENNQHEVLAKCIPSWLGDSIYQWNFQMNSRPATTCFFSFLNCVLLLSQIQLHVAGGTLLLQC